MDSLVDVRIRVTCVFISSDVCDSLVVTYGFVISDVWIH